MCDMGDYETFVEYCSRPNPVYPKGTNGKYMCPVCSYFTLDSPGVYNICPVCFWEDDGTTGAHCFSPNGTSLEGAKENFKQFGACEHEVLKHVRRPRPEEMDQ
jgi:hypothetical protein